MVREETDVVVVGAGLGGLSTAVFLGLHGVPALVVDRHPSTSVQPKARGQNPVVMEGLRAAGVDQAILDASPPGRAAMTIAISRSMAGPVLHSFTEEMPDITAYSPAPFGMASQAKAEAALAARARELGARVSFNTRCESVTQDADGVTVTLCDVQSGREREVRARYLVAADGHKGGLRELAGIGAHGRGTFERTTTVRFLADLTAYAGQDAVVLHYMQNPELPGGTGVIVSTDNPGEWVAGMSVDPDRDDAATAGIIRTLVGVPDLELDVLDGATWEYAHRLADRFRTGRVLLVGDAAHLMPPTGGQGGNTAVLDGYHLGWKLAAVIRGQAGPALLDSHDTERRPFAEAVCEWQVANLVVRQRPDLADDSIGEPMDPIALLFGYACPDGAFVKETAPGAPDSLFDDPNDPSGRPGTRVPHAWLRGPGGPVSPRQLLGPHFLVLTGAPDGLSAAEKAAAELDVPLRAYSVRAGAGADAGAGSGSGPGAGIDAAIGPNELVDPDGGWARRSGVGTGGTVLVRPDGLVAWRGPDPAELGAALRAVLRR
ncbi:FAD-dependent monooxygenase [Pseudonocardia acaciae]|uniref:FAD-dependent monooxygenase n=1 Tax=Pseudonocardia acaciae TaxID=551276 RepID=UPI00049176F8|nr:FAD-dependent monooxygenase [Pseudonocardia acaciae]